MINKLNELGVMTLQESFNNFISNIIKHLSGI